jgi:hypothetical protein
MDVRQERFVSTIASAAHWHYDLDEAVIEFSGGGSMVSHRFVVAGSTSVVEGTWLWSWANDGLPESAVVGIDSVRAYGEAHGYEPLITAEWLAREPLMGDVSAVAGELLGATGYFRTSGGDVSLYLLLDPDLP